VNGAGVKSLKQADGTTNPALGMITTAEDAEYRYDGTVFRRVENEIAFRAYPSSNQSLTSTVITKGNFNTENFDIGEYYNASTYRFTPPAGTYQVSIGAYLVGSVAYDAGVFIYKNGTLYSQSLSSNNAPTAANALSLSDIISLNGTDYIEAYIYVSLGGAGTCSMQTSNNGFSAYKIR